MLEREFKLIWDRYNEEQMKECEALSKDYIDFLSNAKTEREFVRDGIKACEAKGFKNITTMDSLKTGDKVYAINRDKNLFAFVIGKKPMAEGLNLLGAIFFNFPS